jgi:hypothetical protein
MLKDDDIYLTLGDLSPTERDWNFPPGPFEAI